MSSTDPASAGGFEIVKPRLFLGSEASEAVRLSAQVSGAEITLPLHGRAHAEVVLVNWTEGTFAANLRLGDRIRIAPGERVSEAIFDGEITGLEERYGDGAPMLHILLEDRLHRLARVRQNRRFEGQSVDDIIGSVASEAGLGSDVSVSTTVATYLQMNESDLAFVMRLVAAYGIALRLVGEDIVAKAEAEDAEPVALDVANNTARSVRLLTDLNHQPTTLTVNGYDLSTAGALTHGASALQPAPSGTTGADELSRLGIETVRIPPHPFARNQGEAEAMANGQFARAARQFVRGEIVCDGVPTLRSGREIELNGVSARLRGRYRVTDCRHEYGAAGFETVIKVERPDHAPG